MKRAHVSLLGVFAILILAAWTTPASAALTPAYFTCNGHHVYTKAGPTNTCSGNWMITNFEAGTDRNANPSMSQFIGFVHTTPVGGTQPAYLVCAATRTPGTKTRPPGPWYCGGQYSIATAPPAAPHFSWFIGHVYMVQAPGTESSYFHCVQLYADRGSDGCNTSALPTFRQWEISNAPRPGPSKNWFVGYVYQEAPVDSYVFSPKYFIGSVIYVPPGQGPSTLTYGQGTVTGTTVSTTDSWSNSTSISVTAKPAESVGIGADMKFTVTNGGSVVDSLDIVNTASSSTTYRGPASNEINHDYDQILIYLGVKLKAEVDYLQNVRWALDFSQILSQGFAVTGYPITAGCLRPSSVPPALCTSTIALLDSAGITPADYPNILAANPLADPNTSQRPDPRRYVRLYSVNFFPDPVSSTTTYSLSNSTTSTNTQTISHSYTVDIGINTPILKLGNTLTIANSSSESNRTGSNNSSSVTISLPSFPYSGPTTLFIYMDTIYKTFMFSFE